MTISTKPVAVANRIMMSRSQHSGSFLVVEGDTDARFYRQFTDNGGCKVMPVMGRDNVLAVIHALDKRGFKGALGIIDSDYLKLEGFSITSKNVFMTDTRDLETMIIKSPALDKLLLQYADNRRLDEFLSAHDGRDIRDILLNEGKALGYLLWMCIREGWHYDFGGLNFYSFVDEGTIHVNKYKLLKNLIKLNSHAYSKDISYLEHKFNSFISSVDGKYDLWHVCRGHDLSELLMIGIKYVFGLDYVRRSFYKREDMERSLRLSFEFRHLASTDLFRSIKEWELKNHPYLVFAECSTPVPNYEERPVNKTYEKRVSYNTDPY